MNITSAQYHFDTLIQKNTCIKAVINGQDLLVPLDENNRHYQAIQDWVAKGNSIEEAD